MKRESKGRGGERGEKVSQVKVRGSPDSAFWLHSPPPLGGYQLSRAVGLLVPVVTCSLLMALVPFQGASN